MYARKVALSVHVTVDEHISRMLFFAVLDRADSAPLLPNQLKRLARRVSLGLAWTRTISGNGSGDLFMAFSTGNPNAANPGQVTHDVQTIPNGLMDPLFTGVAEATEEAVVNSLIDDHP